MKNMFLATMSILLVFGSQQTATADIVTVAPSNPLVGNCFPFANAVTWGPYMGWVYKDIPAFSVAPGDKIAFDTGVYRPGPEVQLAIHMVEAAANGSIENAGPLTQVVSNAQTPTNPNGDDISGNFEMVFTAEGSFNFGGGGLIIAFSDPSASYSAATGCLQNLGHGTASDPSGMFVLRFRQDDNGLFPYVNSDISAIGGFQVRTGTDAGNNDTALARFKVTKTFSSGAADEVEVALNCNGGLPLAQSFTIAGGDPDGVSFVLTDFVAGTDCEVTETDGPDGYTPVYNNGAGCAFADITSSTYTCEITNQAEPGSYTVNMDWDLNVDVDSPIVQDVQVNIICNADNGGVYDDVNDIWVVEENMGDGDSVTVSVDTSSGQASCSAEQQDVIGNGVETINGCLPTVIQPGDTAECQITNTVFFEGIPSMSRTGMAILAVLMLGLGFVGFRRFV